MLYWLENISANSATNDYDTDPIVDGDNDNGQDSLDRPGPFTGEEAQSEVGQIAEKESEVFKEPETPDCSIEYASTEIIDVPSDSDDDRDYYYCDTSDFNDVSIIDTVKVDPSQPSCSSSHLTNRLASQAATGGAKQAPIIVSDKSLDGSEAMIVMENNNSILFSRKRGSPRPGCSRDTDNASPKLEAFYTSSIWDELLKDAKLIHALLPRFNQRLIYKTLCGNQYARNRVELTLWDLLPTERPQPQVLHKRKYSNEVCLVEDRKNPGSFAREARPGASAAVEEKAQADARNEFAVADDVKPESRVFGEIDGLKTNVLATDASANNDGANPQSAMPLKKTRLNTTLDESVKFAEGNAGAYVAQTDSRSAPFEARESAGNSEVKRKLEFDNRDCRTAPRLMPRLLQPARFTCSNFTPLGKVEKLPYRQTNPILAPPKLKVMSTEVDREMEFEKALMIPRVPMPTMSVIPPPFIPNIPNIPIMPNMAGMANMPNVHSMPNLPEEPLQMEQSRPIVLNRLERPSRPSAPDLLRASSTVVRLPLPVTLPRNKEASTVCNKPQSSSHDDWEDIDQAISQRLFDLAKDLETESNKLFRDHTNEEFCNRMLKATASGAPVLSLTDHQKASCSKENYNFEQEGKNMSIPGFSPVVCDTRDGKQGIPLLTSVETITNVQSNSSKDIDRNVKVNASKERPKLLIDADHKNIVLNEKASKIYAKLIPMFPSTKTHYIKRLCHHYVKDDEQNDAVLLEHLVEMLLNCEKQNLVNEGRPVQEEQPNPAYDMNEKYADLLTIFPEADPVYLRKIVEEIYNDPEKFKTFVQSKLEKPDYPTREQYLAKKKITDQQKQYTTDFKVHQFLEIFPDPFSHFEDDKRKFQFNPHAVDFLKYYFSKLRVNTLMKAYVQYNHNLSLTAKSLEALNPDMKTKRYNIKMVLTEDIPFLQECAFIQHKADLKKYLDEIKIKEEQEFNELKAKNGLIECQCCYDNECMPSKCSTCEDGHVFCNLCIIRSTDVILGDGKTRVDCLLQCGCEFPISVLQQVLPPTKFSILLCKRQEAEVIAAGVEGLVSCPFCHFASIPPPEDKIFKCLNPECMKESCRFCKELNHIPLKCNEKKSESARLYLEEKMTEALVRKCYRCNKMFFKEEGCNKMTCVCGAQMCYICDKPVTDYKHFQGQGAERSNLCPLWSDDRRMNAESVIKVCQETVKQIKEKDPQIDINVAALLPKLPPKSKGPHEDIVNNAIMHERLARQFQ